MAMSEKRMAVVKKHIKELERLIRFYYPDSGNGRLISPDTLLGVLAEALTRIDELVEWKDAIAPGDKILDTGCPCCGAKLEIVHGDDEGEVAVYGTPMIGVGSPTLEARVKELERKDAEMAEAVTDQHDEIVKITRPALESMIDRIARIEREVGELKRGLP